ncbi:aldehyde dehydrogenase family protein, partial [Crossiella equi]|uniref:aldehyde dehydrogenase family protein n=1 Tax=Crossiella equi TaxID=130796 RepID=UPI001177696C
VHARADLRRDPADTWAVEVGACVHEIDHFLANLEEWLRPEQVTSETLSTLPEGTTASVQFDPLGTVLVIAPWNYPVRLLLVPVIGALAAGNNVVVKPSELAEATSAVIARLVPLYFSPDVFAVVEGGVPETTALLAQRFDHIFYTGNGMVGRIVLRAAAEHLTPATLELGGKSPVFVDRDVDLKVVAQRLARVKWLNAGQTCVAPDYVLTDPETSAALERELAAALVELHGEDPAQSPTYPRIINERHFDRLVGLLDSGRTVTGGQHDRSDKFIAPTVLTEVKPDAPVMAEEIFGPILPIVHVADLDEAITFITARDKPLALYAFTGNEVTRARLSTETSSGALTFGQPVVHLRVPELPFGGVGESGYGNYHGRHSLVTFSHRKSKLDVPLG